MCTRECQMRRYLSLCIRSTIKKSKLLSNSEGTIPNSFNISNFKIVTIILQESALIKNFACSDKFPGGAVCFMPRSPSLFPYTGSPINICKH